MEKRHPNHPGELSTDASAARAHRHEGELNARAESIELLGEAGIPFLVGGAYAYASYTGIYRDTKDLDLFPLRKDALRVLQVLANAGWRTERTNEVWIYKAFRGEWFVDVIFSSGNGVCEVDEEWFRFARPGVAFGLPVAFVPPEEMIWSKGFVFERERFDGADVTHLLRGVGHELDWVRLLRRFDRHWEVLLSHLLLFRFSYPSDRDVIPKWIMRELLGRTEDSMRQRAWPERLCRGNLLSQINYTVDIRDWGYSDGKAWDEAERRGGQHDERSECEGSHRSGG